MYSVTSLSRVPAIIDAYDSIRPRPERSNNGMTKEDFIPFIKGGATPQVYSKTIEYILKKELGVSLESILSEVYYSMYKCNNVNKYYGLRASIRDFRDYKSMLALVKLASQDVTRNAPRYIERVNVDSVSLTKEHMDEVISLAERSISYLNNKNILDCHVCIDNHDNISRTYLDYISSDTLYVVRVLSDGPRKENWLNSLCSLCSAISYSYDCSNIRYITTYNPRNGYSYTLDVYDEGVQYLMRLMTSYII